MQDSNNYYVINIREFLKQGNDKEIGEDVLFQVLSDFSCPINSDVELFLKEQSIEFTKKNQSVTYLVFSNDDLELVGYFTIAIKPITIKAESFSNTMKRKISRVSELDENNQMYSLSAYLIAQLGKNYTNGANFRITGEELLDLAIQQIKDMQYMAGGMVVFLEAENKDRLMEFYKNSNNFKQFSIRETSAKNDEIHTLNQLLKVL